MRNLIKAQIYQIIRSRLIYIIFASTMVLQLIEVLGNAWSDTVDQFIVNDSIIFYSLAAMAGVMVAVLCVGGDFLDKTFNYEILNGHTRLEIFTAKSIVAIIAGGVTYLIDLLVPFFISVAVWGFGTKVAVGEVAIRFALSLFVEIRFICIFIGATYVIKLFYIPLAISLFYFLTGYEFIALFKNTQSYLLGITCMNRLSNYTSWMTYTIGNEIKYIYVYGVHIQGSEAAAIIMSSLGIALVAFILGYFFFKKDDLH